MTELEKGVRTAVLVSGNGTNLQALIDARARGALPSCELRLVISSRPAAYALERADKAGIPAAVISGKDYPEPEAYDIRLLEFLHDFNIEFAVCAGFLRILGRRFLDEYENRCVNIHPALLPSYGGKGMYGPRVHEAVLSAGETVTGATVHYVNDVPDGGKILSQKEVPVLPGDTPETLQKRVMEQAERVILPAAVELCCGRIIRSEAPL